MKISIDEIESVLLEKKIDKVKISEIISDLTKAAEEEKEDRQANADPKSKWEYVIVLNDKDGVLNEKEIAGWVVQQKEGQDIGLVVSKLTDAAKVQNESAKRKKSMITDLVSLFESLKPKFTKEKGLRIKTKELTRVIVTNGKLR
jgi:hypothetical protein